jgi:phosphoribosylaminoimidazole carboxylase
MDDRIVGLLGGGQLGRMFLEAANRLNIKVVVLDAPNTPAKQISTIPHIDGSFANPDDVRKLSRECDVLTVEIEHVDTKILQELSEGNPQAKRRKISIQPSWRTIRVIQDKYVQKEHLMAQDIATALSKPIEESSQDALGKAGAELGYPFMLKSRTQAYDGRGNFPVHSSKDVSTALETLGDQPLYAEKWANFKMELAVMVVKTYEDASVDQWKLFTLAFPVVETVHEDSICKLVYAPARGVSKETCDKAQELACRAVSSFWGKGVFGVEIFLLEDGEILVYFHPSILMPIQRPS